MATAQTFIESALRKIGIKGSETPLSTAELSDGLEALNDMGAQLEAEGYELDYTELAVVGDTVTIPAYANEFYKLQLSARLAAEYGAAFGDSFAESLRASRRTVIRNLNRRAVGVAGTYQNIIYGAIELLGVKAGAEPISTIEITNALPRLNDMMACYEGKFRLSYNISDGVDITKEHGLPDWSWGWIKAALAARLASSYTIEINSTVQAMIIDGEKMAYDRYVQLPAVEYPDTLPTGSSRYRQIEFFYDRSRNDLMTADGGTLLDDEGCPLERDYE